MNSGARQRARKIGLCAAFLAFTTSRCAMAPPGRQFPVPERSAGIFIGVEKFSYDFSLFDVLFAVNDAVDLAYSFSIERRMLPANQVLLLLAGEPTGGSRERLQKLIAAGAIRQTARQADIYSLVQKQSKLAGEGGILVLSIATHGYSDGAEHLLMAEDSLLDFRTGISAEKLFEATQPGAGGLRLLLVDACRDRLVKSSSRGSMEGERGSRSALRTESLFRTLTRPGYAVFLAASKDETAKAADGNGLFTGAILQALRCQPGRPRTLKELESFVISDVVQRSNHQQHPELRKGGGADDFALSPCNSLTPLPPPPPPPPPPVREMILRAQNLLALGGLENEERSFRLYRAAFESLPDTTLATLNQGLLARAREIDKSTRRDEAVRIYGPLLNPIVEQSRSERSTWRDDR
jgi:hypothetical protein